MLFTGYRQRDTPLKKFVSALAAGVGLLVGTAALYVGYAAQAGASAHKTNKHINNLKQIHADRSLYSCPYKGGHDHTIVANTILPYIIAKKHSKLHRKTAVAGSLGLYSNIESVRAVAKKAYKYANGTLGKNREYYATVLTRHFLKCECGCADAIVGELCSEEEKCYMTHLNHTTVVELLMDKMKSV